MSVKVREKKGYLYLDIYRNGKRTWEALHLSLGPDPAANKETLRYAEIIRQKRELQIFTGEHGLIDPVGAKQTLLEFAVKQAGGLTPQDHLFRLVRYLKDYGVDIKLQTVNNHYVEGFKKYLLTCPMLGRGKKPGVSGRGKKQLSRRTASHLFKALGQLLAIAERDMLILKNPVKSLRGITVPETIKEYLTYDDMNKLAQKNLNGVLGAEIRRAFFFACFTGLRISDIKSLTWGDINRGGPQIKKVQKKTGRIVTIPLNPAAWALIDPGDSISRADSLIFPILGAKKIDTNKILIAWAEAAGIGKRIGWHTGRRTFATLTIESGADISTVSRLLGHSGIRVTGVYAQSTDKAKREAVNALPVIEIK
jgi:integrase